MYFIRLLTTSGFPRWSWSLKLLLPSAHKKYLSTKQGACTGWAHHGAAPSLSESGFGRRRQWEWQRRSNTGVLLRCGGALELAPRDRADTYPGKSYLRPAVVRSVDASKGRREAQEREPYGWLVWGSGLMRIIFPGSDACWVFLLDFCPPSHLTHVYVYIYTFLHLLPSGAA